MQIENLGFNVKRLRELHGWSQHEMAKRSGLSKDGICKIENQYWPTVRPITLQKLSKVFSVPINELFKPIKKPNAKLANLRAMHTMLQTMVNIIGQYPEYSDLEKLLKKSADITNECIAEETL